MARPGQELFHLVNNRVIVADPNHVVDPGQLNELCVRNSPGKISRALDADDPFIRPMRDERRTADRGENFPHVNLAVHPHHRLCGTGARRRTEIGRHAIDQAFIVCDARCP